MVCRRHHVERTRIDGFFACGCGPEMGEPDHIGGDDRPAEDLPPKDPGGSGGGPGGAVLGPGEGASAAGLPAPDLDDVRWARAFIDSIEDALAPQSVALPVASVFYTNLLVRLTKVRCRESAQPKPEATVNTCAYITDWTLDDNGNEETAEICGQPAEWVHRAGVLACDEHYGEHTFGDRAAFRHIGKTVDPLCEFEDCDQDPARGSTLCAGHIEENAREAARSSGQGESK